jgi:hypothetical protein
MYAIPYTPEDTRQQIMSSFGVYGIPSLIVMDSEGKVITKSGRGAVEGNPGGCVEEWKSGKAGGGGWGSSVSWTNILFYGGILLFWMWWQSKRTGTDVEKE